MGFLTAHHTDIGIKKKTNQDALLIKTAETPNGPVGLFVVCDGMGGLTHGELASATVIRGMSDWFENELPELLSSESGELAEEMTIKLKSYIENLNDKIFAYGKDSGSQLGTTITAFLVIDSTYYTIQIGDSRAYSINNNLTQLTKDQSLVAREVERGNLTEEQAKTHPKRNVLLQCIGANEEIDVVINSGEIDPNAIYLLCTDGFYHEISENELIANFDPQQLIDKSQMNDKLVEIVELVKQRKEVDNISVVLAKVASR